MRDAYGCFQSKFALTQTSSHAGSVDLMELIKVCSKPLKKTNFYQIEISKIFIVIFGKKHLTPIE
jgi:hypothetical protein